MEKMEKLSGITLLLRELLKIRALGISIIKNLNLIKRFSFNSQFSILNSQLIKPLFSKVPLVAKQIPPRPPLIPLFFKKMQICLIYVPFLFINLTFGQTVKLTESEIEKYAKSIEKLKNNHKLVKVEYPEKSWYGGALTGYYLDKNLVLIDSYFGGGIDDMHFFRKFYISHGQFLKITNRVRIAKWEKFIQNYPDSDDNDYEYDYDKLTYIDTIYSITLINPIIFLKKVGKRIISNKIDQKLINNLLHKGQEMILELEGVIRQFDSLKYVKKMPYVCKTEICETYLYWGIDCNIELLIDKLDDTTLTSANVAMFPYNYTVADVAFELLKERIHNIPTFKLLRIPFDKGSCGDCSYWQHLNENFANRQKFKIAVRKWYHKNKKKLTWVKSNDFDTRERGHYEFKTKGN